MPSINLKVKVKVTDNTKAFEKKVEAAVRRWINETVALILERAKEDAPRNFGELAASIHADVETLSGSMMKAIVGTNCGYGFYVEKGTSPHWPPRGPIELWAKRVLGDEKLAFVVARAIAERGTDPQPYLYPAYESALREQLPKFKAIFA